MTEIPTLDLGEYLSGDIEAREALAQTLRQVQETIGFYVVVNHGVPLETIESAYDALREFFSLPLDEKLRLKIDERSVGYIPAKTTVYVTSQVNLNTKPDLNETITLARERATDDPAIQQGMRFVGTHPWPESMPQFRRAMLAYQEVLSVLGYAMLPLYARALGQPAEFFLPYFTEPMWWTRNSYYPAVEPEENQFGISPHSDHGFITLLPLSDVPGLEILLPNGDWLPARPLDGGILVNTGEFLNRWSNGRFLATPHRVVAPIQDRYSMALFFNPNANTVADPLASCVSEENPVAFEPVTMLEYMSWYIDSNYKRESGGRQD